MSQPNTFEDFSQLLSAAGTWDFEGEALMIGDSEYPKSKPNTEGVESDSAGNNDDAGNNRKRHQYTEYQTQTLQTLFEKHPRPGRERREEVGRTLGLTPLQVRQWCEKRRRKARVQRKDHEDALLRVEVKKLRTENALYKKALGVPCRKCGGEATWNERQLMVEIAHLKGDMGAISAIASNCVKEPSTSTRAHLPSSSRPPFQFQARPGPTEATPMPSERGIYHPERSYPDDKLPVGQFNAESPEP